MHKMIYLYIHMGSKYDNIYIKERVLTNMPCKYCLFLPAFLIVLIHYIVMHPLVRPYFMKAWPYCQTASSSIRNYLWPRKVEKAQNKDHEPVPISTPH